ncbi:MAG: universal stress protein [Halolamina sp.]
MYDHVLIGVDGSEEAERAARRGLDLAETVDASVTVVHVLSRKTLDRARGEVETEQLRDRAAAVLDAVESIAAERGQSVETEIREGSPAAALCEYAAEADADLLVLGRQGLTGIGRRLLGGVTERVLNRGAVPALVVPDEATGDGYDRLLVPTDGSENAAAAYPHAGAVATAYGAAVDVLNVVDLQDAAGAFHAGGLEASFVERLEAEGEAAVADAAAELAEHAPGVAVRTAVERTADLDGAAAGIRAYVAEQDVDLVAIGSRGRSDFKRALLGSVASKVLRSVDVPVLVAAQE